MSMRLDVFIKLQYESNTIILFVGIRYSMHDLRSDLNAMPNPQTSGYGKRCQRFLWHQLVLTSCEFYV